MQMFETGESQQVIIAVGRGRRSGQWPDQEEPVVDDIEGFRFGFSGSSDSLYKH